MSADIDQDPTNAQLLNVAIAAAYAAGRRTLAWFDSPIEVTIKGDGTPVTEADREAERLLRAMIGEAFPTHDILGEEFGTTEGISGGGGSGGTSRYRWVLDPIDGTKSFVAGVPLYGTMVACERDGVPVVGVVYMPALDEMVAAAKGLGCTRNGRPCQVSKAAPLSDALVAVTDIRMTRRRADAWDKIEAATRIQRTWADCYAYVLVATGRAQIALDPEMSPWDCAAVKVLVEEAGGTFTSWKGEARIDGGDAVATGGVRHEAVLAILKDAPPIVPGE